MVLAICLLLALPITASADPAGQYDPRNNGNYENYVCIEEETGVGYATLRDALLRSTRGNTIRLMQNIN